MNDARKVARGLILFIFIALIGVVLYQCSSDSPDTQEKPLLSHGQNHQEGEEGEEEEEENDLEMSLDEILSARCEHEVWTVECDECRYEVGVVKVDSSLMEGGTSGDTTLVETMPVSMQKISAVRAVNGEVQLNKNRAAHISSQVSGVIRAVNVDLGDIVSEGDVLFELESVELGEVLGEYARNLAMAELARKNYIRERGLHEKGISSEQEMIEAKMEYEEYQTDLRSARQKLSVLGLSEGELDKLGRSRKGPSALKLPVKAPFNGTVIKRKGVIGEQVEAGSEIMMIADLGTLWVWADVYEKDLGLLLDQGSGGKVHVEVYTSAFANRTFKGQIDYIGNTMEEATRTVKVRVSVENEGRLLRPGMFCEVRIPFSTDEEAIAVPEDAVLSDEGIDFVFIHLKDEFYVRRPVKRGREFGGMVEIIEGLKPGQAIVTRGAFLLKSDVLREKMGAGCAD